MPDYRKMVEELFLAPARGWLAQAPKAPPSMGLLGDIHNAIDPVNMFGGYGGLAAMALPPGGPTRGLKPVGRLRNRRIAPAILMEDGSVMHNGGKGAVHHVDVWEQAEKAGKVAKEPGWVDLETGKYMTYDEAHALMDSRADTINDYLWLRKTRKK